MSIEHPLDFVKRHLKEAGPSEWPRIAKRTGKSESLLRKIAYGDRKNPRLDTLMPLVRHFERSSSNQ